eukprot:11821899-Ditylum_brightwellii.AAC.1
MQSDMLISLRASIEAALKQSMEQMTSQMSTQIMHMNASGLSSLANTAIGPNTVEQIYSISATQK